MKEKKPYLECAKICNTHGLKGDCKAECWCDSPAVLCRLRTVYRKTGDEYIPLRVASASPFKGMVLMRFEGVNTCDDALPLKGQILYARREDIPVPEGAVLLADMIGLPVIDAESGKVYGELTDIEDAPASAIYTVRTPEGKDVLLPAVPAFIRSVDAEKGVFVTPIPGFFDGDES